MYALNSPLVLADASGLKTTLTKGCDKKIKVEVWVCEEGEWVKRIIKKKRRDLLKESLEKLAKTIKAVREWNDGSGELHWECMMRGLEFWKHEAANGADLTIQCGGRIGCGGKVCGRAWRKVILCARAWTDPGCDSPGCTLLHEMVHKCDASGIAEAGHQVHKHMARQVRGLKEACPNTFGY